MNKKTIVLGITIFFIIASSLFSPGFAQPKSDHMIPGMLTDDAPYYKYIQSEAENQAENPIFDYVPPEITGSIGYWIEEIDESMVLGYIQDLVDFGPRVTESSACDQAGTYIYNEFSSMGLDVEYHNWTSGSLSGKNVEATLEGLDSDSDKIFLVLGHYDSVSGSPGADDNAAGTTAALAAAEILSQYRFKHTIRFLAVDGEEQGLHGSSEYAEAAANNGDNIISALNADMIGYAPNEGDGDFINVYTNDESEWLYFFTENISQVYSSELNGLQTIDDGYISNSDHASFVSEGYDANCYHEYNFNDYYHSPNDLIEHMNMTYDAMVTRLVVATLAELAEPIIHEHDIMVSDLEISSTVAHGETQYVQATITNVGNNTETNVIVDFIVNESVVNSKLIPSLNKLESTNVNFTWNPDYGTYFVEIESQVITDEGDVSNNNVNKTVEVIPAPAIEVTPLSISYMMPTDATDTESFTISNLASAEASLEYNISYAGDQGGNWLSASPDTGVIPVGGSEVVTVTADTTGLSEGEYVGEVVISSNDLDDPEVIVAVDLTVVYGDDMKAVSVNSPVGTVLYGDYTINATVQNIGFYDQTDVTVNCSIFEGGIGGTILDEDFSSNPSDWTITHVDGTSWTWDSSAQQMENSYSGGPNAGYLDSPVLDCSGKQGIALSFWHDWKADYTSGDQDGWVRGSVDGGNTFPYLIDEFHHNDPPEEIAVKTYDLPWADNQENVVVRFEVYNDNDWHWYVDDVNVSADITGPLVYYSEQEVDINAYESTDIEFSPMWNAIDGVYGIQVSTLLGTDENPVNDHTAEVVFIEGPALSFDPIEYNAGMIMVNETDTTTFDIWNSGLGTLSYTLTESCGWLDLSSYNGDSTGEHDTITLDIDTAGLEAGSYHCDVNIDSNGGTGIFSVDMAVITSDTPIEDVSQGVFDRGFPIRHAVDGDWAGAQNFTPTMSSIAKVDLYLRSFGTPEFDLVVELREDGSEGTLLDSVSFTPGEVPSSWEWFSVDFTDAPVVSGTDYFIVCPPAPSGVTSSFGYEWGYAFGNQYDDGSFWFTRDGGNLWRDLPSMYEFTFATYGLM